MTLTTMLTEIRERLGEPAFWAVSDDPSTVGDFHRNDALIRRVNSARRKFLAEEAWPWMWTTQSNIVVSAGNSSVELIDELPPTRHAMLRLYEAGVDTPIDPERVSVTDGFRLEHTLTAEGRPLYWYTSRYVSNAYEDGDVATSPTATLIPTPAIAYTAKYVFARRPTNIVYTDADLDDGDIPEEYAEAIISWATGMSWLKEINSVADKAQDEFAIYAIILDNARRDMKRLSLDQPLAWGGTRARTEQGHYPRINLVLPQRLG